MPSLELAKLSTNVIDTKYQVRGIVYLAAQERLRNGKEVIMTSVGNPQALGQVSYNDINLYRCRFRTFIFVDLKVPLTFLRQVIALVAAPFLLEDPAAAHLFPKDAIRRARE